MNKYRFGIIAMLLGVVLGLTDVAEAQNGFNIPFSQFGIGSTDLPLGLPSSSRMGGVVYSRSSRNTVNPFNPASYSAVEMESFVFDIGVNVQSCVLRNDVHKQTDADGSLAYLMVAFPLTKWWKTSAGVLPYSMVSYESVQTNYDALTLSDVKTIYAQCPDDDGIGLAIAIVLMKNIDKNIRVICTVDEEDGMNGAINLDSKYLDGEYLINIDWEDALTICNSSAGGKNTNCHFQLPFLYVVI